MALFVPTTSNRTFDMLEVRKPTSQHSRGLRSTSRTTKGCRAAEAPCVDVRPPASGKGPRSRGATQRRVRPTREAPFFRAPTTEAPPKEWKVTAATEVHEQLDGCAALFVSSLVASAVDDLRIEETCTVEAIVDSDAEAEDSEVDEEEIREEAAADAASMLMQFSALVQPSEESEELPAVEETAEVPSVEMKKPFRFLPSAGSWLLPRPVQLAEVPAPEQAPEKKEFQEPSSFRLKPSVGSWMQVHHKPTAVVAAAPVVEEKPAEVSAPATTTTTAWKFLPSVGSWHAPLRPQVTAAPALVAETPKVTEPTEQVKPVSWNLKPSVGSWMQIRTKPAATICTATPAPQETTTELKMMEVRKYMQFAWERAASKPTVEVDTVDEHIVTEEASNSVEAPKVATSRPTSITTEMRSPTFSSGGAASRVIVNLPAGSPGNVVRTKRALGKSASLTQLCPEAPAAAAWSVPSCNFTSMSMKSPPASRSHAAPKLGAGALLSSPTGSRKMMSSSAMLLDLGVEGSATMSSFPRALSPLPHRHRIGQSGL
mmetsp:Transcript_47978/g.114029  ORF Transcript_47978/g.114029 Transcript_47978/m.114029 type:complete len:542 (+) Transcript_47978:90-1715(+)